ncbi:hypothetical protein KI387_012864, partial [Taxus chinensis]
MEEARIAKICENVSNREERVSEKRKAEDEGYHEGRAFEEPRFMGFFQKRWWRNGPVGQGNASNKSGWRFSGHDVQNQRSFCKDGEIHPRTGANAIPLGVRRSKVEVPSKEHGAREDVKYKQGPDADNECWLFPKSSKANGSKSMNDSLMEKEQGGFLGDETSPLAIISLRELEFKVSNSVKTYRWDLQR